MQLGLSILMTFFAIWSTTEWTGIDHPLSSDESEGIASYYHNSLHGLPTASGEIYDTAVYSAAHKTLPLGSFVLVEERNGDHSIMVKVNDRLPANSKRLIDLSWSAAQYMNMVTKGLLKVKLVIVEEELADRWYDLEGIPEHKRP